MSVVAIGCSLHSCSTTLPVHQIVLGHFFISSITIFVHPENNTNDNDMLIMAANMKYMPLYPVSFMRSSRFSFFVVKVYASQAVIMNVKNTYHNVKLSGFCLDALANQRNTTTQNASVISNLTQSSFGKILVFVFSTCFGPRSSCFPHMRFLKSARSFPKSIVFRWN